MTTAANKLSYFNAQTFKKSKASGTFRIFCLGGSTTFGRPFDDRTSYAAWLRELLPLTDNGKHWEVINAGGISYASYRVAVVLDELVRYSPDLFVIYTGHNEFLEDRTYADIKSSTPFLRHWSGRISHSRTYSILRRAIGPKHTGPATGTLLPGEVDTLLDHSVGPEAYHRDDRQREGVIEHFGFNLDRMINTARSVGARVICVTPAANLKDFSPFKSEHDSGLGKDDLKQWSSLFDGGENALSEGHPDQTIALWRRAEQIDPRYAQLHYRVGNLLHQQGRYEEAHDAFQRAIDEDVCPLRAPSWIQQMVEEIAVSRRVPLVDFQSVVNGACMATHGHNNPGREYFVDHVHPTVSTHRLLALSLIDVMSQMGVVTNNEIWNDEAVVVASERIDERIDLELQAQALTNLAQVLAWAGKQDEAGPIAERAVSLRSQAELGDDAESMFYAAVSLAMKGRDQQAVTLLERVVELEPTNSQAQWRLGALRYDQLAFDEALECFRQAVRLDPKNEDSQRMLCNTLIQLNRYEEALDALNAFERVATDLKHREFIKKTKATVQRKRAG